MPVAPPTFRPWPHRLALLTACAVLPLIFVGAGVTSKDAGMAYRDGWFSDGYFWNPPDWTENEATLWEHGHRLLGRAVGLMAIALAVVSWRSGGVIRTLGIVTLLAIIAQGLLGYFRVDQISRGLAMVHGIGGQICFCIVSATVLVTSRRWIERAEFVRIRSGDFLGKLALLVLVAVFLQLLTGAATRHFPSNLAVGSHVFLAIIVTFMVGWIGMWVTGSFPPSTLTGALGRVIALTMAVQLFLGGGSFLVVTLGASHNPLVQWLVPTLHAAVGACLLVGCWLLYLTCRRMVGVAEESTADLKGAVAVG